MTSREDGGPVAPVPAQFRLYVAGESPNSLQALANFVAFAESHLLPYTLEVVDAMEHPQRALDDGVLVTPTLLRLGNPVVHIVGNLSDTPAMQARLGASALAVAPAANARIQALIHHLLETETELEALIAGEGADAIVGATGEPMLLRDARHAMRRSVDHFRVLAHHDPLTGVANRLLFASYLQHAIERSRRQRTRVALLYLDVDHFKEINDNFGHGAGDNLLRAFSERISRSIRAADTIARVGGDEFAVLLEDVEDRAFAGQVAGKIRSAMEEPFDLDGNTVSVSTSIGIGLFPDNAKDAVQLTDVTDSAMYRAKARGRGEYAFADG